MTGAALVALRGITTATVTTILLKTGLRSVGMRGSWAISCVRAWRRGVLRG
jgi:hypothetical protein